MNSIRQFLFIIFRYFYTMPHISVVPHIVGDDDSESVDENKSSNSPNPKSPSHSETSDVSYEGTEAGTDEDVTMDSFDGADWSMIVSHIARTPKRESSPNPDDLEVGSTVSSVKDEELPSGSQCTTPVLPPKLRFRKRMTESQPYPSVSDLRRNCASKADYSFPTTIGGRVARRGRRSISTIHSPEGDSGAVPLAKPLEVTAYFHKVSSDLVQKRVSAEAFKSLREQLDRLLEQHSNSSKTLRKRSF